MSVHQIILNLRIAKSDENCHYWFSAFLVQRHPCLQTVISPFDQFCSFFLTEAHSFEGFPFSPLADITNMHSILRMENFTIPSKMVMAGCYLVFA